MTTEAQKRATKKWADKNKSKVNELARNNNQKWYLENKHEICKTKVRKYSFKIEWTRLRNIDLFDIN